MKKFIAYLQSSFDTHSQGASARKLTAWWFVILITIVHITWLQYAFRKENFAYLLEILLTDFAFVTSCLGMTAYETNTKIKMNSKSTITETPNSISLKKEGGDVPES